MSARAPAALALAFGGAAVAIAAGPGARAASDAAAGLHARATLAFDGRVPEGAASELALSLHASRGGEVRASVSGAGPVLTLRATLAAGEARTLRAPLRPDAGSDRLRVRVEAPGGESRELEVPLEPAPLGAPRIAVAAAGPEADTIARRLVERGGGAISLPASVLPFHAEAYEAVDAVVVDAGALLGLEPEQARALEGWLAGCGRVVALAPGEASAVALRAAAGCRGAALAFATDAEAAADAALLRVDVPPVPDPRELARTARPPLAAARAVAAMLGLSALALVTAAGLGRTPLLPLATPLLAAGLALAGFGRGDRGLDAVAFSLQESGDDSARWSASLRLGGEGRGELELEAPPGLPLPRAAEEGARGLARIERDETGVRLVARAGLLAPLALALHGAASPKAGLVLALEGERPVVRAGADAPAAGALLCWRDRLWRVPRLAPGASWSPAEAPEDASRVDPLAQALRAAGLAAGPLLVVPFVPPAVADLTRRGNARGWLLIKAPPRGADA